MSKICKRPNQSSGHGGTPGRGFSIPFRYNRENTIGCKHGKAAFFTQGQLFLFFASFFSFSSPPSASTVSLFCIVSLSLPVVQGGKEREASTMYPASKQTGEDLLPGFSFYLSLSFVGKSKYLKVIFLNCLKRDKLKTHTWAPALCTREKRGKAPCCFLSDQGEAVPAFFPGRSFFLGSCFTFPSTQKLGFAKSWFPHSLFLCCPFCFPVFHQFSTGGLCKWRCAVPEGRFHWMEHGKPRFLFSR